MSEEPSAIAEKPGSVVGNYELLEQIGEGGFGIVFMAEQIQPVRRTVALKVIKPGMDSRQVIARFEAERQAIALMDHPNIARVLDAGSTSDRPYFVMELVRGIPITDYCDQNALPMSSRLELFVKVCLAIQHSHHKGVIHRDIKPTNVLVTLHDGMPVVKVIDFGIAKAIGQQLTDKTLHTGFAQMIGTPMYMSPEQAEMSGLDIDTRTDIYSLGVLLYELLTGTTPFDRERVKAAGYDELRRMIREEEPPRPSTRLSTLGMAATTQATRRQSDPKRLCQSLKGELDWIVMKALEKDRTRRYETASAFAADVQHYLADEPVTACPPSAWYRFRKLARRRRAALVMAGVVSVALVLGIAAIAGSVGWALNDRAGRDRALDGEVNRILDEAVTLMEAANWQDAEAALGRAAKLQTAAGRIQPPPKLLELQKDLGMVGRLEELYGQFSNDASASLAAGDIRGKEVGPIFSQAFQDYGINIATLSLEDAAQRIGERTIRLELARALDFWSSVRRRTDNSAPQDWKRMVEIAKAADADSWRNQIRDALARHDQKELEKLAASVDVRQVPPRTLLLLGNALNEMGLRKLEESLLRKAQALYPGDLWINEALAWACRDSSAEEALQFFTAALALRPDRWQTWFKRADVYNRLARWDKAAADFSSAIDLNPTNAGVWLARAGALGRSSSWDEAIRDATMSITLEPKKPHAYFVRGGFYRKLQQWDRASADYDQMLTIDIRREYAWYFRGECQAALSKWDIAAHDLDRSLQLKFQDRTLILMFTPPRDVVWMSLACYRAAAADGAGHRKACADFLARYGATKKPLEACRLALSFFHAPQRAGAQDPAVRLAAFAAANAPRDRWCAVAQGAALCRMGQYEQCVQWLEQLQKSSTPPAPSDGVPLTSWLYLTLAHHHLGHAQQARTWLQMAIQRMNQEIATDKLGPLRLENRIWAMCLVLRREAEGLLAGAEAEGIEAGEAGPAELARAAAVTFAGLKINCVLPNSV